MGEPGAHQAELGAAVMAAVGVQRPRTHPDTQSHAALHGLLKPKTYFQALRCHRGADMLYVVPQTNGWLGFLS